MSGRTPLVAGLCSITLRALTAEDVVAGAARARLGAIAWGADGHVLPGDVATAAALARRGRDQGIEVASYGSYLGVGPPPPGVDEVTPVLDVAEALGTTTIRVWTELGITPESPIAERDRVRERTAELADAAAVRGLDLALEFHPGTLTHTAASTVALLDALDRPNLRTHWQPDPTLSSAAALDELRAVLPHLASLHAFTWGPTGIDDRRPLAEGEDLWPAALALAARSSIPNPRNVLCEYVRADEPEQLVADAATLHRWIDELDP